MPILLLSGGIESATLLYERRGAGGLRALFIDYGQRAARPERRAAVALCETTGTLLTILPLNLKKAVDLSHRQSSGEP